MIIHRLFLSIVLTLCAVTALGQTYKPHQLAPSLRDQALAALQKGDNATARSLYERWLEADPRDNASWYNLACVLSLAGEKEKALDAFERAVDAGWKDAVHPTRDTDLDPIRSDARFGAAVQRIADRNTASGPRGFVRHYAEMRSRGSYIVMLPPDYETSTKEYPICVILHGSGSSDLQHGRLADTMGREGVIYIAPRAPYPHTGVVSTGSLGWTAWPPDNLQESDPNLASVPADYIDWIFACVSDARRTYRAQKGKVYIYGHSQGGSFANMCAIAYPDRVASYYSQAASLPRDQYLKVEQVRKLKENNVRAYLIHGEQDKTVPVTTSQTIDRLLTEAGVDHTLRLVPGDHGFNGAIINDVRSWVEKEVRGR